MLNVVLLGERRLLFDGRDVGGEVQYRKAWALLGYLAIERGRRHSREQLAELLWPALPPVAARTNLRQVVSNLNRVFESCGAPELLLATREDVGLYPHPAVRVDLHELERVVEAPSSELLSLDECAVDLGGEFLAGLHLDDCPDFEQWLQPTRSRLAASGARALRRLLEAQQAAGIGRRALATVKRLVALDPWDESAVRQCMSLLAADGQCAEALQLHERLTTALLEDMGTTPTQSTTALRDAIRAAMDAGLPFAPSQAVLSRTWSRHWACGLVCRVHAVGTAATDALLADVIAHVQGAGARLLFANRDTAYLAVVAEADPGDPTDVALRAARLAADAMQAFHAGLALALSPALVQSHPQAGLALVGNAGEWAAHLLPQARSGVVLVCESLFENLFEAFALHPHAEVPVADSPRPMRIWRLGAEGVSTSSELAETALAEAALPSGVRQPDEPEGIPELLTLRLGEAPPDEDLSASAWLTVVAGADRGKRAGVGERPLVLGRSSDCDLQLPRRTISRHHCVVWRSGEHYRVRDLGATNPTLVNGSVVRDTRLVDGDRVTVGECTLVFGSEV